MTIKFLARALVVAIVGAFSQYAVAQSEPSESNELDALLLGVPDIQADAAEEPDAPKTQSSTSVEDGNDPQPYLEIIPVANKAETPPPTARSGSRVIEEIVVTSQKREESVQDVPIMISAFSGEKLDAFGVETTEDLQRLTPGLSVTYTFGYALIFLRGVGTDAFLPNADPSIATYIDGMNIGPSHGKQDSLGPIERVEVLKGPQGTLFGRNATGGAISIITADAPDHFVSTAKASFGNYNSRKYQLYLGTPITDYFGATLALFQEGGDLYGRNEIFGQPGPTRNEFSKGGRLKLQAFPTEDVTLTLVGTYSHQFNTYSLSQQNTRPAPILAGGVPADELDRVWHNDFLGGIETINKLYGATLGWTTDFADIKLIASMNEAEQPIATYDFDSTETSQATFFTNGQFSKQNTYELQFVSNESSPLSKYMEWAFGFYRLESEGGFDNLYLTVNALGLVNNMTGASGLLGRLGGLLGSSNLGGTITQFINSTNNIVLGNGGVLNTVSDSAYLQTKIFLTDALDLTLGVRYQEEVRGLSNSFLDVVLPTAGNPPNEYYYSGDTSQNVRLLNFTAPDLTDQTWSPTVALQYRLTDSFQIFTSAKRAYKSPTYNIVNFFSNPDAVERETATAYELGFKSDLLDGALRLNAAVFHTQIDDLLTAIVSMTSGGIVRFRNAGQATINGVEFDLVWQPLPQLNPGLAVTGGATYLDAKYTDFSNGAGFDDDTGLYFGDDSLTLSPGRDFTGNDVVRTPDLTANLSVNQFISAGRWGDFEIGVDYYRNSGFNTTAQNSPLYEQPAYDLWSARLSYFYEPLGLQLTAFVENAADEVYSQSVVQHDFGRVESLGPPRLYGLRFKWDIVQ